MRAASTASVDVGVGVRRRDDHVQEEGGARVDAEPEELVDEAPVDRPGRRGCRSRACRGSRSASSWPAPKRQHLEHRPDALHECRDRGGRERVRPGRVASRSPRRVISAAGRAVVLGQHVEALGRDREGEVGRVLRAVVQHAAAGEGVHDLGPAGDRGERQARAERLPEGGQVAGDAVERLASARMEAKAGHRLVDDQERAVLVAQAPHLLEIARPRRDHAHVRHDRLCDDRRHPSAVAVEAVGQERGVVPRAQDRVGHGAVGQALRVEHARRVGGIAERGRVARVRAHEERVVPAVVVALELDDERTAGDAPARSGSPPSSPRCRCSRTAPAPRPGRALRSARRRSASISDAVAKSVPCRSARSPAATRRGWACP